MNKIAVCIISGGMDSALSAKMAELEGYGIIALHFNYGQRTQTKELECFRKIAKDVDAEKSYEIDLGFFEQIGASALTDMSIDIPTMYLLEMVYFSLSQLLSQKNMQPKLFT